MIDGAALFALPRAAAPSRFLILREAGAHVALQVDDVLAVGALAGPSVGSVPALTGALRDARWVSEACT